MPSVLSHAQDQPCFSGSRQFERAISASVPTSFSLGQSLVEETQNHFDRNDSQSLDPYFGPSSPATNAISKDLAARKAHNARQPISRLSVDILEYLFLHGASLASFPSSHSPPSYRSPNVSTSIHHRDSPTRTILTYAQLTSPLRRVALSSPRLWVRLIDFESASERWTEELLRRSVCVGVDLVFQWSKAQGPLSHRHTNHDTDIQRRVEDTSKKTRLESMLRHEVLSRTRTMGVAVPAPYFANVLLDRLSGFASVDTRRLDRLETLRMVRSPLRGMPRVVEGREMAEFDEEKIQAAGYVPLAILGAAPNLQELAIAQSCLPFYELFRAPLPLEPVSSPVPSLLPFGHVSHSSSVDRTSQALHTPSNLKILHIVDLPLHLAPSAREWLIYLSVTPALEELVLEGAMISATDLFARADERAHLRGVTDAEAIWHDETDSRLQAMDVPSCLLPRLRVLTVDAALEDIGVLVASLPTPHVPSRRIHSIQVGHSQANGEPARNHEWVLRCAGARTVDGEALDRLMAVFSRAVGVDGRSQGTAGVGNEWAPAEQHAALSATETDVHIHLRSGLPEASSSIHVQLNIGDNAPAPMRPLGQSVQPPSESLVKYALGSLESTIMPCLASLEMNLPPYADTTPLRSALGRAVKVTRLGIGKQGAKTVLKILRGGPFERKTSVCSRSSSSSSLSSLAFDTECVSPGDVSSPLADSVLLPSLKVLDLVDDGGVGPVWTALLRYVKARRASGVPVAMVNFISGKGRNGHIPARHVTADDKNGLAPGSSHSILSTERAMELQGLNVNVTTCTEGYLF